MNLRILPLVLVMMSMTGAESVGAGELVVTEPRNAAVGFAIVSWMFNADALRTLCARVPGTVPTESLESLKAWQRRNGAYVDASLSYMVAVEDLIQAKDGGGGPTDIPGRSKARVCFGRS